MSVQIEQATEYPTALYALIKYRGYTNKQVAEGTGFGERSIRQWAKGRRPLKEQYRAPLAKFLECEIGDLAPGIDGEHLVQSLRERQEQQQEGREMNKSRRHLFKWGVVTAASTMTMSMPDLMGSMITSPFAGDLKSIYEKSIRTCQDLYHSGKRVEAQNLLPLYRFHIVMAEQSSSMQKPLARFASQVLQLEYELAAEQEQFGPAREAIKQAYDLAEHAEDRNLMIACLMSMANMAFHQKDGRRALSAYQKAISLFNREVTPLSMGRTYAGITEVEAMLGNLQKAMTYRGLAHEIYPQKPEEDRAYPDLRASRYPLHVFAGTQAYIFLGKPEDAEEALIAMQKETKSLLEEPENYLDYLLYQSEINMMKKDIPGSIETLRDGATLARKLNSTLYFNKLRGNYNNLKTQWGKEPAVVELKPVFYPVAN